FAAQFPKVAARLGLEATEVADPYVERLLEGFSFLSARVRLKLDAEFPRFTQHLLEMVYPHYFAPTPSMVIAQFVPAMTEGALARLSLYLAGSDEVALKLYELLLGSGLGVLVAPPARPLPWFEWLGREAIQPVGFAASQALIPYGSRSFSGYRLLHEYFAFPESFRFAELVGLR